MSRSTAARALAKTLAFRAMRMGFRVLPLSEHTRDKLRQRFLARYSNLIPEAARGISTTLESTRPRINSTQRAIGYVAYARMPLRRSTTSTIVAFFLPQFHPIPENDKWWGAGFTEWQNVARALPQFEGHAQPRLPGELGFYDLRTPGVMKRQMTLAREYGVGAFCSYFYWFAGRVLLEEPLEQWLADRTLDLPLCLCWANENWSRRWDGREDDVLIEQRHSNEDDLAFISYIAKYLRDPRYLRVDGKPMILVYRPGILPDAKATAQRWRSWCLANDIGEIHLAYVQSFDKVNPTQIGFDAAVSFPPNNTNMSPITHTKLLINREFGGTILDWRELAASCQAQVTPDYPLYPGVNCGWDNEPRRSGAGRIYANASPRIYKEWLSAAIALSQARKLPAPLVFVNAWNEWAEGAVLEPDQRLGYAWLKATLDAQHLSPPAKDSRPCVVIHAWDVEVLTELLDAIKAAGIEWRIIVTAAPEREQGVRQRLDDSGTVAEVVVCENRGRDVLPFLKVASMLLDEGVETVLKIHTKQSSHRSDGAEWRRDLIGTLISASKVGKIRSAFDAQADIGLVAPDGHLQRISDFRGGNQQSFEFLCRLMNLPVDTAWNAHFVAGSMFWLRLAALRPLLDAHPGEWLFEEESGQIDGTFAHAVERVIALAVESAGFRTVTVGDTTGGAPERSEPYRYANRQPK